VGLVRACFIVWGKWGKGEKRVTWIKEMADSALKTERKQIITRMNILGKWCYTGQQSSKKINLTNPLELMTTWTGKEGKRKTCFNLAVSKKRRG
jgi:hypothetical protein